MSYSRHIYHLVFRTKFSRPTITEKSEKLFYNYLWGICKNEHCFVHRIGGMPDHVHVLLEIPPTIAVADLVQKLKQSSSHFIHNQRSSFLLFEGWAEGYASFTYCQTELETVKQYISNQKEHHKKKSFKEELEEILLENNVKFDTKYL